jgi:hypothetical protein
MQNHNMSTEPYAEFEHAVVRVVNMATSQLISSNDDDLECVVEDLVLEFEDELGALAKNAWEVRAEIERLSGIEYATAFQALDSILGSATAVSRILPKGSLDLNGDGPPQAVQYSAILLLTRLISVGHEISALLRAGFPIGAISRWRTLYELDVISTVLARGNRGTAARFMNNRWIMVAKKPQDYFFDEDWRRAKPAIDKKAKAFRRRYGERATTQHMVGRQKSPDGN